MHPINRVLSAFGLRLSRIKQAKKEIPEVDERYEKQLQEASAKERGFDFVFRYPTFEDGQHPMSYVDFECAFAAYWISKVKPIKLLDLGSYRHFVIGMLSNYRVTTIDVRARKPISDNEVVITCDAKNLNLPDDEYDAVVSLCALEHFGLGRYGDEFDLDADKKAFNEMIRVLKPDGRIIFTTAITRGPSCMRFNQARFYNYKMIRAFCVGLVCEEERFYSHRINDFCSFEELSSEANTWDVYCGCWRKDPFPIIPDSKNEPHTGLMNNPG